MKSLFRPYILPIFLMACLAVSVYVGEQQRAEIERLKANQQVLLAPETIVEYRTTTDGKAVAQVQALNLQLSELKATNDSLLQLTRDLGIKNRRLLALAQATTETTASISAPLRDSIVSRPVYGDTITTTVTDTLRCLSFADPWLSLSGCIEADTFTGHIESRDTLDFIAHRVPKHFLFFRFGCKAIRLDVVSHNPHSILTHVKYIRLTK